jgi:adenosine deaminase
LPRCWQLAEPFPPSRDSIGCERRMPIDPDLARRLTAMPKVEIHVHLEGATDAGTIFEMAQRNHVELPAASLEDWKRFYEFRDFNHFIEVYITASRCMCTPQDYARMCEQFLKRQAEQNISYSEVTFTPSLHLKKLSQAELLSALGEGSASGHAQYGTSMQMIADISRHTDSPETQKRTLEFALAGKDRGLFIGLGLGGKEIGFPPEQFADIFAEARRQGLHVVAHAGETDGPASIRGAIESLRAERIGHGVRCLEDLALVELLRERRIPMEVCPQSNYCLGVVKRGEAHPIRRMMDAGLFCTLNSDDPPMFSTSLTNEYLLLAEQGFSWQELWELSENTRRAAFSA